MDLDNLASIFTTSHVKTTALLLFSFKSKPLKPPIRSPQQRPLWTAMELDAEAENGDAGHFAPLSEVGKRGCEKRRMRESQE